MRELLKEARDRLLQNTPHRPGTCFECDNNRSTIAKITAALAEPEPDAMEIVEKLRLGGYALNANDPDDRGPNGDDYHFTFSKAKAASQIEDYGRRVPRVFVEEILDEAWNCLTDRLEGNVLQKIAAKHGVKVED